MAYIDTKYIGDCKTCRHQINRGCDTWCDHGESYQPNMSKIPAADVVEVKRGKWTFEHDLFTDPKRYFIRIVCSCCGLKTGQVSNYCPNCGAKMDGERKTE